MASEIERKFLVTTLPDLTGARRAAIRQGYITHPDDSCEVRLRQKGARYLLTVKSGSGLIREEHEAEIPQATFDTLWPTVAGHVCKTRYTAPLGDGLFYELDIYEGHCAPLITVEVEFATLAQARAFRPPAWFGREVTGQRAYSNRVMALRQTDAA